jgi:hypothetical protein
MIVPTFQTLKLGFRRSVIETIGNDEQLKSAMPWPCQESHRRLLASSISVLILYGSGPDCRTSCREASLKCRHTECSD